MWSNLRERGREGKMRKEEAEWVRGPCAEVRNLVCWGQPSGGGGKWCGEVRGLGKSW